LVHAFGFVVMKAAALVNLPVYAGRLGVMPLYAIHAEVVFAVRRMFRIDKRAGEKRAAVFLPRRQNRQLVEPCGFVADFRHGRTPHISRSEFQRFKRKSALVPQLFRARRHERLDDADRIAHELFGFRSKREFDASRRAEHIRHDRIRAALHALEKQRGSATGDDAAVNFGEFEVRINFRFDFYDFVFASQQVEE
jgi:hypothetical protein